MLGEALFFLCSSILYLWRLFSRSGIEQLCCSVDLAGHAGGCWGRWSLWVKFRQRSGMRNPEPRTGFLVGAIPALSGSLFKMRCVLRQLELFPLAKQRNQTTHCSCESLCPPQWQLQIHECLQTYLSPVKYPNVSSARSSGKYPRKQSP